ncbi:hypothetical protein A6D6_02602 [Alcanivorax xiamenensis]|uniref:Uncharacterized protein n=1 Tax=Alcanivorax xiamenensis TaxID=1177156 RepID=A0ABQ6Y6T1_9GAMM|nr:MULTISPECIES: hypothetical protein [Alcanivorax]KAF0805092.1 hypothetical protein A6D6_02602 [Alcanivorax xiamenensis]
MIETGPVFTLADIKQSGSSDDEAMAQVLRWLESGRVRQVAPPRPVFVRCAVGEVLADEHLATALRLAFPSLVIIGGSALWRHQVSRERDARLDCAVSEETDGCVFSSVRLHRRPSEWLREVSQAGGLRGQWLRVPLLSPEMAVADAAAFTDVWVPDQGSVDWDSLDPEAISTAQSIMRSLSG